MCVCINTIAVFNSKSFEDKMQAFKDATTSGKSCVYASLALKTFLVLILLAHLITQIVWLSRYSVLANDLKSFLNVSPMAALLLNASQQQMLLPISLQKSTAAMSPPLSCQCLIGVN